MQEQVLRLYENSVLLKIFGSNRQKIQKLHSQEARNFPKEHQAEQLQEEGKCKSVTRIFIIPTKFLSKNPKAKLFSELRNTLKNGTGVLN